MQLPIHVVDAFTKKRFGGNPAAVVPLESWLPDETLQSIALENNLSETAFLVPQGDDFEIRWFTPGREIDLCGHATLGAAFVLATRYATDRERFVFLTREAGTLTVVRKGETFELDFPSRPPAFVEGFLPWTSALGGSVPREVLVSRDYVVVYANAQEVAELTPDFRVLGALDRMVIATAPGDDGIDYVLRFFAPIAGVDEDPVTGSAQSSLTPFWAARLGKERMEVRQLSRRGGALTCTLAGDRVLIAGHAVGYMDGVIEV